MTLASRPASSCFGDGLAAAHGSQGQGTDMAGLLEPAFLALVSDQGLRRLIITGLADLGMPDYADSSGRPAGFRPLTSDEIESISCSFWPTGAPRPVRRFPNCSLRRRLRTRLSRSERVRQRHAGQNVHRQETE